MSQYLLLRIEFSGDREDALLAALYSGRFGDCLGVEQESWFEPGFLAEESQTAPGVSVLIAYYAPSQRFTAHDEQALRELGATGIERQLQSGQDWQANYRQLAQPIEVGAGFVLDPREPFANQDTARNESDSSAGRRWLKLPARQAFGTGSHETTQLMIEGMERLDFEGRSVLDVGVGSGVLSLVARTFGAARICACDIELLSALATIDNGKLNQIEPPGLFVGRVEALSPATRFDCVLVNVLEERIADSVTTLQKLVAPGGDLLVSGCLTENRARAERSWQTPELRVVDSWEKGEWLLLQLAGEKGPLRGTRQSA